MKLLIQRLLVTVGLSSGIIAVTATAAQAGIGVNHSEPVARDHHASPNQAVNAHSGPAPETKGTAMKLLIQRLLVTVGFSSGIIAVTATAAHAGMYLNHCEPLARTRID